jgi:hypothetical protein
LGDRLAGLQMSKIILGRRRERACHVRGNQPWGSGKDSVTSHSSYLAGPPDKEQQHQMIGTGDATGVIHSSLWLTQSLQVIVSQSVNMLEIESMLAVSS